MRKRSLAAAGVLTAAVLALYGCGAGGAADGADKKEPAQDENKAQDENAVQNHADMQEAAEEELPLGIGWADDSLVRAGREAASAGVTFSVTGDSISTYRGYNPEGYYVFFPEHGYVTDVADTWWQQVADDLEWTLLANGSSSGATVAGDSTGTTDPQCACNELRTDALFGAEGGCPDKIIVYLGANDMIQAVPLGDNDGTRPVAEGEIAAFSDAYTLLLDKLHKKYPSAEIYCCTLHRMGNYGTETPYVEFVNGIGLTAADYGKVIVQIAEARGLSVIDLYDCGIRVENLQETTSDGVHPTTAGMDLIAEAVKQVIAE